MRVCMSGINQITSSSSSKTMTAGSLRAMICANGLLTLASRRGTGRKRCIGKMGSVLAQSACDAEPRPGASPITRWWKAPTGASTPSTTKMRIRIEMVPDGESTYCHDWTSNFSSTLCSVSLCLRPPLGLQLCCFHTFNLPLAETESVMKKGSHPFELPQKFEHPATFEFL